MERPYSILLVDDDKFLLEMYRKKFEERGVNAEMCPSPSDALDKLRSGANPDMLILDIIMPGMDGIELLRTIRKEKLCPDALVVMLTNESDSAKIEDAKSLGAAGYIVKATNVPSGVVDEILKIAHPNKK